MKFSVFWQIFKVEIRLCILSVQIFDFDYDATDFLVLPAWKSPGYRVEVSFIFSQFYSWVEWMSVLFGGERKFLTF